MAPSALLRSRVCRPSMLKKLISVDDLDIQGLFPNGSYIGWSGFTGVGFPKLGFSQTDFIMSSSANKAPKKVPTALANHVEKNDLQRKLKYSLFVGASSGAETESRWARLDMIGRRSPHQVGKDIARGIKEGRIQFWDKHLSMIPVEYATSIHVITSEAFISWPLADRREGCSVDSCWVDLINVC